MRVPRTPAGCLALHSLPPRELIVSSFLPSAPFTKGALALQSLGSAALRMEADAAGAAAGGALVPGGVAYQQVGMAGCWGLFEFNERSPHPSPAAGPGACLQRGRQAGVAGAQAAEMFHVGRRVTWGQGSKGHPSSSTTIMPSWAICRAH